MFVARFGHFLDKPFAGLVRKIPIPPTVLTVVGFFVSIGGALLVNVSLLAAGLVIFLGGVCDAADGIIARTKGKVSVFGGFLDSVLDRCSDSAVFLAIAWYFGSQGRMTGVYLSLITLVGAYLTSYTRVKAESLGADCRTGLLERPERVVLTSIACVFHILMPVMWVFAVLSPVTVVQRIWYVRKQMYRQAERPTAVAASSPGVAELPAIEKEQLTSPQEPSTATVAATATQSE